MRSSDWSSDVCSSDLEPPTDDAPAIYVVRDGRSSIVSYWHYLQTFGNYQVDLKDVVLGNVPFGSWSEHVERWSPDRRRATLLLQIGRASCRERVCQYV